MDRTLKTAVAPSVRVAEGQAGGHLCTDGLAQTTSMLGTSPPPLPGAPGPGLRRPRLPAVLSEPGLPGRGRAKSQETVSSLTARERTSPLGQGWKRAPVNPGPLRELPG